MKEEGRKRDAEGSITSKERSRNGSGVSTCSQLEGDQTTLQCYSPADCRSVEMPKFLPAFSRCMCSRSAGLRNSFVRQNRPLCVFYFSALRAAELARRLASVLFSRRTWEME